MDNRFKQNLNVIRLPKGFEEEARGGKTCCEPNVVLAHLTEIESWKNDVLGVVIKKSDASDIVTISMEDCRATL